MNRRICAPRHDSFLAVAAGTLILAAMPAPSAAGSLHGRVIVSGAGVRTQTSTMNPYQGTLGSIPQTGAEAVAANPADVVVYLKGQPAEAPPRPTPHLYQINQQFEPRVLGVPVGTTVEFPNKDAIFHNVFSYSKPKRFDLGYYGKDKSRSVLFDKPGLVKVFCDIHSTMSAFILVVDSPLVTQPDARGGTYAFDNIPDGDYTLHTWHPEAGFSSQKITVSGDTEQNIRI